MFQLEIRCYKKKCTKKRFTSLHERNSCCKISIVLSVSIIDSVYLW